MKPANPNGARAAKIPEAWQAAGVCVFLALAVLAAFAQTAHFDFVNCDDDVYVYKNAKVLGGLSLRGIGWAFTHVACHFYHPLTMISLMLDEQIHGRDAGGYHLTNVLIHTASVILLFLVLRRMTGALWRSAFAAAVFGVHPLRAESVAWVTERKDVLGAFFFMLTLWAYARYVERTKSILLRQGFHLRRDYGGQAGGPGKQKLAYSLVLLFFVLGLLCKPTAVALPFLLLLLDYWPLGRLEKQKVESRKQKADGREQEPSGVALWGLVREKIPLLAMAAAASGAAYIAQGKSVVSLATVSAPTRIGNALISYVVHLRQTFWPSGLAFYYSYPDKSDLLGDTALAFAVLAIIFWVVLAQWRKRPWLLVGWLWYVGMLVPVIGLVAVNPSARGDRNTYLPQIGLCMLAAWAAADLSSGWRHRRAWQGALAAGVLGALIFLTRTQTSYWRDSATLWTRALACVSENSLAQLNLGADLCQKGDLEGAILHCRMALEIKPDYPEAYSNLGTALGMKGELDAAMEQYRKALEIEPDYEGARNNLGSALCLKGDVDGAIAEYRKVLELNPEYESAVRNLGAALAKKGDLEEAIAQYRKALDLDPEDVEARYNLGKALLHKGDFDAAMACLQKSATPSADPATKWRDLGNAIRQKGDLEEAVLCYQQAIRINPRSPDAYAELGLAFFKEAEIQSAVGAWEKSLEIKPDQIYILNDLAWLLATSPDASLRNGRKAVALAKQAGDLGGGGNPMTLHTLAAAYGETGDYGLAATTARRALELASGQKNDALAGTLQKEIQLYEAGKPVREGTPEARAPAGQAAPP